MRLRYTLSGVVLTGLILTGSMTGLSYYRGIKSLAQEPAIGSIQVREGDIIVFRDFPVFDTIENITREADLIVVGTVGAKAGSRNLARNPLNPSEEATDRKLMSQEYEFVVETTLKGAAHDNILIVYPEYGVLMNGEKSIEPQVPLDPGQRYILSLKQGTEGTFYGIGEPWQFKLTAGQAQALSTVSVAQTLKGIKEADFIRQIRKFAE